MIVIKRDEIIGLKLKGWKGLFIRSGFGSREAEVVIRRNTNSSLNLHHLPHEVGSASNKTTSCIIIIILMRTRRVYNFYNSRRSETLLN